ncbi:MAG: hypothetical protein AB1458_16735, partial [Bacteroidota bacterium]
SAVLVDMRYTETQQELIVVPGVGFDQIIVGQTLMNDIVKIQGRKGLKRYKRMGYATFSHGCERFYVKTLEYRKRGITFSSYYLYQSYSNQTFILASIRLEKPGYAKTTEGIILGQSTSADVEGAYGKSIRYLSSYGKDAFKLFYPKAGISFDLKSDSGDYDTLSSANKVIAIEIFAKQE